MPIEQLQDSIHWIFSALLMTCVFWIWHVGPYAAKWLFYNVTYFTPDRDPIITFGQAVCAVSIIWIPALIGMFVYDGFSPLMPAIIAFNPDTDPQPPIPWAPVHAFWLSTVLWPLTFLTTQFFEFWFSQHSITELTAIKLEGRTVGAFVSSALFALFVTLHLQAQFPDHSTVATVIGLIASGLLAGFLADYVHADLLAALNIFSYAFIVSQIDFPAFVPFDSAYAIVVCMPYFIFLNIACSLLILRVSIVDMVNNSAFEFAENEPSWDERLKRKGYPVDER